MKFRTVTPQLNFPSISEGFCPPQTAFLHNECYKQVRGSQRMITRHLFECWIRECSGLIRKRVSSAVSCSWSWSPLEGLISSSTSAFRARELLCVIAIAQIHVLPCIIFRWVSEGRKLLGSNNRQFVSQFVSLNGATLRAPCCVLVDRGLPAARW
jgi:hypothetical protein